MRQFELDFDGGLIERFPGFGECVKASVYCCGRQLKAVAADLDMSPSELSRKLAENENDPVHFPASRLPELIAATGNLTPIYWLLERFCEDQDGRKRRSLAEIAALLPRLQKLVEGAQ